MTTDPTGELIASVTWKPDVLRLEIDTDGGWFISIDNDFIVESLQTGPLDSRDRAEEAAALMNSHIGEPISVFDFSETGNLRMSIGDITLAADPAYDFEAWHATGPWPEKHMIICQPGGGIA